MAKMNYSNWKEGGMVVEDAIPNKSKSSNCEETIRSSKAINAEIDRIIAEKTRLRNMVPKEPLRGEKLKEHLKTLSKLDKRLAECCKELLSR